MSHADHALRRLRRLLAGHEPSRRDGLFAEHRRRFEATRTLVAVFYGLFFVHLVQATQQLPGWLALDGLEGRLWPFAWVGPGDAPAAALLAVTLLAVGTTAAALAPHRRGARILAAVGLFAFAAFDNSFGKVDHSYHAWILAAAMLVALPDGRGETAARSVGFRQRYLLVFAGAQALFLSAYSLAGFWKVWAGTLDAAAGRLGVLSPTAFSYLAADRLLQTSSESVLGPLVVEHPALGWLLLAGVYVEVVALVIVFRRSLLPLWGALLIALHLGSLAILSIDFRSSVLLAVPLLLAAPGATVAAPWSTRLRNLPGIALFATPIRALISALRSRPRPRTARRPAASRSAESPRER